MFITHIKFARSAAVIQKHMLFSVLHYHKMNRHENSRRETCGLLFIGIHMKYTFRITLPGTRTGIEESKRKKPE